MLFSLLVLAAMPLAAIAEGQANWWNKEWLARKQITLDTGATGSTIGTPIGTSTVLVRLSDANFQFALSKEEGADLRFIAEDHKTVLSHHIERWDAIFNEALVWVKVPEVKAAGATSFWLYYNNQLPATARTDDAKGSFDDDMVGVYHMGENNAPPADATVAANAGDKAGSPVPGSLIAGGLRLVGPTTITFPNIPATAWTAGGNMTWSAWIKPSILKPRAVLFSRRDGANAFIIGEDNGVLFAEVAGASGVQKTSAGAPIAINAWHHVAVTASGTTITIFVNGETYGTASAALPAMATPWTLGKDASEPNAFAGEIDEVQLSKSARSPGWIKFATINQGVNPEATKLLSSGADEISEAGIEKEGELAKHVNLIKDISKDLTLDGWIVIWLCIALAIIGWGVALFKLLYLNKISRASKAFIKQWKTINTDITALDHADEANVKSMGGATSKSEQALIKQSPLFHLYHLGSQEIQHRIDIAQGNFKGLPERSIAAIRAILDGGIAREVKKLNDRIVFLTIGIAGGPYLGLLGTVIGVMITFAVIAKSGEVEINSIAPGIAGALLATVAGLAVAIPALFAYSYLSSRIKDATSSMHTFIDEFIARIAEAYPSQHE